MTNGEAIKELEIIKQDYWDNDGYGHETKQYDDTMLALDMAIEALNQRWIPVTERLPEEGQFIIVSYPYDASDCSRKRVMTAWYHKEYGFTCGITDAWMPLPQPYKAESEG